MRAVCELGLIVALIPLLILWGICYRDDHETKEGY